MDSLLAGYGSDSSGRSDDDDDGDDDENHHKKLSHGGGDDQAVAPAPVAAAGAAGAFFSPAKPSTAPDDDDDDDAKTSPPQKRSRSPPPPPSPLVALGWWTLPPPETRGSDHDDAFHKHHETNTLIHWPHDYLTPLQRRAAERAETTLTSSTMMMGDRRQWGHDDGLTVVLGEAARKLQDSHDFTNPNQLRDAAQRLGIRDALGSSAIPSSQRAASDAREEVK